MERTIKGYMIRETGKFILQNPEVSRKMPAEILAQIRTNESIVKPADWYPLQQEMQLLRAIAGSATDEHHAKALLVACGEAACAYAVGTFMKLLLKVLSPQMFAKKFPDLWSRDYNFGRIEVIEVLDKSMHLVVHEVDGYDHIAPLSQGFGTYTLRAMGLQGLEVSCGPWSLEQPSGKMFYFKVKWG